MWIEDASKYGIIRLNTFKLLGIIAGLGKHANFWPCFDVKLWIHIRVHIARLLFDRRVDRLANVLADIRLCETVTLGFQDGRRRESVPLPVGRDTQFGIRRPLRVQVSVILALDIFEILDLAEQPMVL